MEDTNPTNQPQTTPTDISQPTQIPVTSISVMDIKPIQTPQPPNEETNPSPTVEQIIQPSTMSPTPVFDEAPVTQPQNQTLSNPPETSQLPQPETEMTPDKTPTTPTETNNQQPKPQKRGSRVIILALLIVAILIAVAVYVYLLSTKKDSNQSTSTNTATVEKVTSDDANNTITQVQNDINSQNDDKDFPATTLSDATLNL